MQINVVQPEQVEFFWPAIERFIRASQERGPSDMSVEEIKGYCRTDPRWRLLIFDNFQGAAVIRIWDEWLHVVAIGGKLEKGWHHELFVWLLSVAQWARLRFITLGGRKGWSRFLKPMGFRDIGAPFLGYEVELEDET